MNSSDGIEILAAITINSQFNKTPSKKQSTRETPEARNKNGINRMIPITSCFSLANYKFNPNKPGIFQWQSVDDVFLMVVD